jgi:hypothetical protein
MSVARTQAFTVLPDPVIEADRLLTGLAATLRADGRNEDPGSLLKMGQLRTRLDAVRALGTGPEAEALTITLLHAISASFPASVRRDPQPAEEDNHLRFEAIGRSYLIDGIEP